MKAAIADRPERLPMFGRAGDVSVPTIRSAKVRYAEMVRPNSLVRWAFYLSIFALPFYRLYIPGTGDRVGVTRFVQMLLAVGVASQPRVCLRFVPAALLWFLGYVALRLISGFWFTPELRSLWWPSTFALIQFSLPWVWIIFNLAYFPKLRRTGLWALVWGCSLCALLHVLGIGVNDVDNGAEGRSTIFLTNANSIGADYAVAMIIVIGLGLFRKSRPGRRITSLALLALLGTGLAKTGSRSAALLVIMGTFILLFESEALSSKSRRFLSLLLIIVVLAGVISQVPTVLRRFEKVNSSNIREQEGRVRMMPVLWEMFLRSPIYGSGPDQYQVELTRRAMPYLIREHRTITSHNLVLLLLVETGVIGFLVFAIGIGKTFMRAWIGRAHEGFLPLALLGPYIIAAIIFANPMGHEVFWFVIAYGLAGTGSVLKKMENSFKQ